MSSSSASPRHGGVPTARGGPFGEDEDDQTFGAGRSGGSGGAQHCADPTKWSGTLFTSRLSGKETQKSTQKTADPGRCRARADGVSAGGRRRHRSTVGPKKSKHFPVHPRQVNHEYIRNQGFGTGRWLESNWNHWDSQRPRGFPGFARFRSHRARTGVVWLVPSVGEPPGCDKTNPDDQRSAPRATCEWWMVFGMNAS